MEPNLFAKPAAFFLRDLRIASSYRLSFATTLVSMLFGLLTMEFISRLIDPNASGEIADYGGSYFTFALVGTSFALYGQAVARQFPTNIRSAQVTGTMEVLLATRTSLAGFLSYSSIYGVAFALMQFLVALVLGAVLLDAKIGLDQALLAMLVVLLVTASHAGIGILSAAFVVWFKQNEPFTGVLVTASLLAGGLAFPTSVLPDWLAAVSPVLPATHAATALRDVLINGASLSLVTGELLVLTGFALLLPASLAAFGLAIRHAKVAGTLSHY
jgi:ABC-2 type transport system permease protein